MGGKGRAGCVGIIGLAFLAACSSKALTPDAGAPKPDGASDTPVGTMPETGMPDAPMEVFETGTPDATTDLAEVGVDGGLCGRTNLGAVVALTLPDGTTLSCSSRIDAGVGGVTPETWIGKVTGSDATSLLVEVCGPGGDADGGTSDGGANAGCVPSVLRIEAYAPGLDLSNFPLAWVRVRASVTHLRLCQQSLEITTAAPTDGTTPAVPVGQLLLAVVDGNGTAFADSPYKVAHSPLDCGKEMSCGFGMIASQYAFDFQSASGADSPLRVYMGETVPWTSGGTIFTVHNLRSYDTGYCDDYWNWAYTIYVDPK